MFIAEREPPNAETAAYIFVALAVIGLAHSWWRRRKHPLFGTRKKPGGDSRS
jgi:hypothetical protein